MADLSDERAFYYVDGIPTKGVWIDLDSITDEDDIKQALADAGLIPTDDEDQVTGTPQYDGDLLVATVDGVVAKYCLSSHDCFDLAEWQKIRDDTERKKHWSAEAVAAYLGYAGSWSKSDFEDVYQGEHDNEESFAEQLFDDLGYDRELPEHLRMYFDMTAFARDLFIDDYYFNDGFVFRRN